MTQSTSKKLTKSCFFATAGLAILFGVGWLARSDNSDPKLNTRVLGDSEMATIFGDLPALICNGTINCETCTVRTNQLGKQFAYSCGTSGTRNVCCSNTTKSGCNPANGGSACGGNELYFYASWDANNFGNCGEATCNGPTDQMKTCGTGSGQVGYPTNATGTGC